MPIKSNKILGILSTLICLGIFLAGLWPFNFRPVNHVSFLPHSGGLHFDGSGDRSKLNAGGMVFTPDPLAYPRSGDFKTGEISIELCLRPAAAQKNGVPRIVTFYDSRNVEKLIIGQWRFFILARIPPPDYSRRKPYREIGARKAMDAEKVNFVTLTSGHEGSAIYIDGELSRRRQGFRLLGPTETLAGYRLYLGNSSDIASPWAGDILGVALYGKSLTRSQVMQNFRHWKQNPGSPVKGDNGLIAYYLFDKADGNRIDSIAGYPNPLSVPEQLIFSRKVLAKPNRYRVPVDDVILNIIGFIPFGFVFAFSLQQLLTWQPARACLATIVLGALISLGIELLQAYLPTRDSSQLDLICNTLGTVVGVSVGYWVMKREWIRYLLN